MDVLQDPQADAAAPAHRSGWRTVLVHAEPRAAAEPRLKAAAALARRFDAHLIGLGAERVDPQIYADINGGAWDPEISRVIREEIDRDLAEAQSRFRTAAAGISSEWRNGQGLPAELLCAAARAADVIVAGGAPPGPDRNAAADIAETALRSGRPVLVAPRHGGELSGRTAIVAWKEAREARRAVIDALPLLRAADAVIVVAVCDDGGADDADFETRDVAAALKRRGVNARQRVITAGDERVGEVLNDAAADAGADLIVAGCYGRNRLDEFVFGGATRSLLHAPDRYLLLSH